MPHSNDEHEYQSRQSHDHLHPQHTHKDLVDRVIALEDKVINEYGPALRDWFFIKRLSKLTVTVAGLLAAIAGVLRLLLDILRPR